MFIIRKN